jgi:putative spermidine/putrescine transport system permease protein
MYVSRPTRWLLRIGSAITLAFLYLPLVVIGIYAFNARRVQAWPLEGTTTKWFSRAFHNDGVREALHTSLKAGLGATAIALLLGTLAALAVSRYRFFGRETISFLVILPIALPGIVTGMALNSFYVAGHVTVSMWTIVIGHATFCVVIVYNNALARLRRSSPSLIEASRDLGASGFETFRRVILPVSMPGIVAGLVLIALPMFGDFFTADLMSGSPNTNMLGNTINGYIQGGPDKSLGAALTMLMSLFLLVFMTFYLRSARREQRERTA